MFKKKRVVILGPVGYPGGLQTHYRELTEFLIREGFDVLTVDVEIIATAYSKKKSPHRRYSVRNKPGIFGKVVKFFDWIYAVYVINRFRPLICIAVANGYGYAWMAKFISSEIFKICTEVTSDFEREDNLRVLMSKNFNATIVQSPGLLLAQREKIGKKHTIAVMPCFAQQVPRGYLAAKPAANERIRLVFFGRLARNKGLQELLQVLSEIAPNLRPCLDIWGNGDLFLELQESITTLDLKEDVALKGQYPTDLEYAKLLASYHGLVLPSQFSEGLPLVLLEASSVGLPFLSTDIGAIHDCTVNNQDVTVIGTGILALRTGIRVWLKDLAEGKFKPIRLQEWFLTNHSRNVQEECWKKMLIEPVIFFKNYD